jgi:hypothetical protein
MPIQKKNSSGDEVAKVVADLLGVTSDYVRKVVQGKRNNQLIVDLYRYYRRGKLRLLEEMKAIIRETKRKL